MDEMTVVVSPLTLMPEASWADALQPVWKWAEQRDQVGQLSMTSS